MSEVLNSLSETILRRIGLPAETKYKIALGGVSIAALSALCYLAFGSDEKKVAGRSRCGDKQQKKTKQSANESVPQSLKAEGNKFFKEKKYDEAIDLYTKALASAAASEAAVLYQNRAAALDKKGEREKALSDLNECLRLDSKYHKAYARRATIRKDQDPESALIDITAAAILSNATADYAKMAEDIAEGLVRARAEPFFPVPGKITAYCDVFMRAMSDAFLHDPIFQFTRMLQPTSTASAAVVEPPEHYDADFLEVLDLFRRKKFEECNRKCEAVIQRASICVREATLLNAILIANLGNIAAALELIAGVLSKTDLSSFLRYYAMIYEAILTNASGLCYEKATKMFMEVEKIDDKNVDLYYNWALIDLSRQNIEGAMNRFDRAVELYPSHGAAKAQKLSISFVMARQQNDVMALSNLVGAIDSAAKRMPNCVDIQLLKFMMLTEQNSLTEAERLLGDIERMDPSNPKTKLQRAIMASAIGGGDPGQQGECIRMLEGYIEQSPQTLTYYEHLIQMLAAGTERSSPADAAKTEEKMFQLLAKAIDFSRCSTDVTNMYPIYLHIKSSKRAKELIEGAGTPSK